jgi:hypothetical protein
MIPKEVFLSHSSQNRITASNLAEVLRVHGVPVWYSTTNIQGARQWHDEIGRALRRCDWFLVLLSRAAVVSPWVKRELMYALNHSQYEDHILPVLIEQCAHERLSWTLEGFQMVNLFNNNDQELRELLKTWGLGYDRDRMR